MQAAIIGALVIVILGGLISVISVILDAYFILEGLRKGGNRFSIRRRKSVPVSTPRHVFYNK